MLPKQRITRTVIHIFFIAMLFFPCGALHAQEEPIAPLDMPQETNQKIVNLAKLQDAMDSLSREIVETRNELTTPEGQGREKLVAARLSELNQKLFNLEQNFNDLASEISLDSMGPSEEMDFNWSRELKVIMGPLIRELQRATSRPREIEKHRSDIKADDQQLDLIKKAMGHVTRLMESPSCTPRLRERLDQTLSIWKNRKNEIETLKNISQLQLDKISGENEPLSETIQKIPKMFFKSHGSNFLLSIIAFSFLAFILYRFHGIIRKISPFHKKEPSFYVRVFDLGYGLFVVFICMGALLGVLYYLSDWVLLSLILFFMIGLAWTSKEALPRFWNQGRLILNLGPVREGELIVYNSLPYQVLSINLYTLIYNPAIPSSKIRLPVADLLNMRSRPVDPNEPWFPSRINDWVLLDSENPALVLSQTPETVIIQMIGGARQSYTTSNYISAAPVNLSSGFRIKVLFGLDYALQHIITENVPVMMKKTIESELFNSGFREHLKFIRTDFKQASSSSLDIEISVDLAGSSARDYVLIKRLIQKSCVDTCNSENWNIPFNQLTIHMENNKHS